MSVRHAIPNSAAFPAAGRLIVAVAALIVVGSALPTGSDSSPGYSAEERLSAEADQMMATIEALSDHLAANESPELAMAWEDLRRDLQSVNRDLENARSSVDLNLLVERVGTFRVEFATAPGMRETAEVWDQLTNQLEALAGRSQ
jgi:hypothetical protein